jgi:CelD/BcsL family acetyltransferase involved in cellulose biosynthesis
LAILLRRAEGWHRLVPILHLTSFGDRQIDSPFIEYNGLLVEQDAAERVSRAMLDRLAALPRASRRDGGWRLLSLPGIDQDLCRLLADSGLVVAERTRRPAPFVDLGSIRPLGTDFLATRSRNFRWQVRRSLRLFAEQGPVRLERAQTLDEAFVVFDQMKELHQRRWTERGQRGAFSSKFFERFHRRLIATAWADGKIDLLRLKVGDATVGCLYNFLHGGAVYAYQSGFHFTADARLKPGLVCHCLAIERYLATDLQRYLLLAGESDYKSSLASGFDLLDWVVVHRSGASDRMMALLSRLLRRLKENATGQARGGDHDGVGTHLLPGGTQSGADRDGHRARNRPSHGELL